MDGSFPYNLSRLREKYKISQTKLAAYIGVKQQTISAWEHNRMEPTMSNLWEIADIFDLSIDELIGRKIEADSPLLEYRLSEQFTLTPEYAELKKKLKKLQ